MMSPDQLRGLIREVLTDVDRLYPGLYSDNAVELLMFTAAVESRLGTYIQQIDGPAEGIFQMEPATEQDIWDNYLRFKPRLRDIIINNYFMNSDYNLKCNLAYQIIMARLHYRRVPHPLPSADSPEDMALYHKIYYNTYLGASKVEETVEVYKELCL